MRLDLVQMVCAALVASLGTASCSASSNSPKQGSGVLASAGTDGSPAGHSGSVSLGVGGSTGSDAPASGGACAVTTEKAHLSRTPIDIIFMIDNSGSMSEEIEAVRERINSDFASIIAASGADYRVIMISAYGKPDELGICVAPPLGAAVCGDPLGAPSNSSRLFLYTEDVDSTDAWCKALGTFDRPDIKSPLAPNGWQGYLRPEAFKSFVVVSDDNMGCVREGQCESDFVELVNGPADEAWASKCLQGSSSWFFAEAATNPLSSDAAAAKFDASLLQLSPEQFGTPGKRNYRYHSIVGLAAEGTVEPSSPAIEDTCPTAENAGEDHQALSRLTGGLRFSICSPDRFADIFRRLADDAVQTARVSCDWPVPSSKAFDANRVNVEYRAGGAAIAERIEAVPTGASCGTGPGWFYDDAERPTRIQVCPATCEILRKDAAAQVDISLGCETKLRDPR